MGHIVHRLGIRIGRGWVTLILLAAIIAGGAYWIGPLRTPPAELRLVVVTDDSVADGITVAAEYDSATERLRFALPLAVQNVSERTARPTRVVLNVPARFAVSSPRGRLTGEVTAGVPLRRYVVDVVAAPVAPGGPPQPIRGLEQIWLEPDLPRYYCTQLGDGIPEFVPAPRYDAASLADVRIFYSLTLQQGAQRSSGLLSVRLDPERLTVSAVSMPPAFPTVFEEPEVQAPELGPLLYRGSRTAWCGDPERPLELFTVTWETQAGARFHVIHVQGQPRKHLYDLTGDGTVELETWDVDGDGRFEARRQARFTTPEFLLPLPTQRPQLALPDTTPPDSAWLELFRHTAAGPFRFALQARTAPERLPGDTTAGAPVAAALEPLPPPDSAWLDLFLRAGAGPFRFTRRAPPVAATPPADTLPADTATGAGLAELPVAADSPVAEPDTVAPPPRPPAARRPIGTPVQIPPPDTLR